MPNVTCTACDKGFMLGDSMLGKRVRCPSCGNVFLVSADEIAGVPQTAGEAAMMSDNVSSGSSQSEDSRRVADVIDYEIFGAELQYVEITLDPTEQVLAEAGAMMHLGAGIEMEAVVGDSGGGSSFWGKLKNVGKRIVSGETMQMTTFTNIGKRREVVAFSAPYPGKILPVHLDELGGEIIVQKDAFLCGARGIQIEVAYQKGIGFGLFGGDGYVLQRLKGDGIACLHAGGTIMHRELPAGETLKVDAGCLLALQPTVQYDIDAVEGFNNSFFGGEGLNIATLNGPGRIWLQSLPISRLSGRLQAGGKSDD